MTTEIKGGLLAQGSDSGLPCESYCEHGGVCTLNQGHAGRHDSLYCQWDDAKALTKEQADAKLTETPQGRMYLSTLGPFENLSRAMVKALAKAEGRSAPTAPPGPAAAAPQETP